MAVADVFLNRPDIKDAINEKVLWALLPVSIVLGTWNTDSIYPNLYTLIHAPFLAASELQVLAHILGATIVILSVLKLNLPARLFATRPLQYLGKISFSLYLTHFAIMGSLACFLFSHLAAHVGYALAVFLTFVPSMAVTFAIADLYTRYVDVPSISLSKSIGNALVNGNFSIESLKRFIPSRKTQPSLNPDAEEVA